MKRILFCFVLITCLCQGLVKGQPANDQTAAVLAKLYSRIISATNDKERLRINDSVKLFVGTYAASEKVFGHKLKNLRYLGQIESPDSLIKILTWNLALKEEPGKYFCYFIRKAPDGGKNIIYTLTRDYDKTPIRPDTVYSQTDWYGALYYDIRPFHTDNRECWILLGISLSDPLMTRKVIDVLSFSSGGGILFGRKWFDSAGNMNYRHVLEYSSTAVISLRFNSDSTIVFDHLVPLPISGGDNRIYYGPDFSTDAFVYENKLWSLTINVETRNDEK